MTQLTQTTQPLPPSGRYWSANSLQLNLPTPTASSNRESTLNHIQISWCQHCSFSCPTSFWSSWPLRSGCAWMEAFVYQPTGNLNAFYLQPLVGGLDAVRGLYSRVKRAQLSNPSLAGGGMQPSIIVDWGFHPHWFWQRPCTQYDHGFVYAIYDINVPVSLHELKKQGCSHVC